MRPNGRDDVLHDVGRHVAMKTSKVTQPLGRQASTTIESGRQRVTPRMLLVVGVFAVVVVSCSSDSSEPITTFDETGCTYAGPAEFALGTEATFTFVNTSEGTVAGYSVWKVPDGTTVADIEENTIFGIGAERSTDMRGMAAGQRPGDDREIVVALDAAGLWAVNCFAGPSETDFPATVFVVTDS